MRPGMGEDPLDASGSLQEQDPKGAVTAAAELRASPRLLELHDKVEQARAASKAESTRRAYEGDWRAFSVWCAVEGFSSLPALPAVVAAYAADLASPSEDRKPLAVSTIARRLAAIAHEHHVAELPSPCSHPLVRETMAGIRNELGVAPRARKRGVSTDDLRAAVGAMGDRLIDVRDRALLLVGFASGFRRGELVALDVDDVMRRPEGVVLTLRRSKRDQQGKGHHVGIVYGQDPLTCPVRALRAWLEQAGITGGPVFRSVDRHGNVAPRRLSPQAVALVVKRHMGPLGHRSGEFAAHSLRRGMATTASANGARDRTIMEASGHASVATLAPYIEEGRRFDDPASGYLGL